jgi:biopolymer transport protein ExbD
VELRRGRKKSAGINLTSLIDVQFLLIIFFMVSTTFVSQPAIKLELPKARHSEAVRQSPIVIYMDQHGAISLNDEPMELPLLEHALVTRLAQATEKSVVLKADARVSHGDVVRVLDIIKGAGVTKIVIGTQEEP